MDFNLCEHMTFEEFVTYINSLNPDAPAGERESAETCIVANYVSQLVRPLFPNEDWYTVGVDYPHDIDSKHHQVEVRTDPHNDCSFDNILYACNITDERLAGIPKAFDSMASDEPTVREFKELVIEPLLIK